MSIIKIYTVVPKSVISRLHNDRRVRNIQNLRILHQDVLSIIKEKFLKMVGYSDDPIAAICSEAITSTIEEYIPINFNESIVLEMKMEQDMIISINHDILLTLNDSYRLSTDAFDRKNIAEELYDELYLGEPKDDSISFIPFVQLERCASVYVCDEKDKDAANLLNIPQMDPASCKRLIAFY